MHSADGRAWQAGDGHCGGTGIDRCDAPLMGAAILFESLLLGRLFSARHEWVSISGSRGVVIAAIKGKRLFLRVLNDEILRITAGKKMAMASVYAL